MITNNTVNKLSIQLENLDLDELQSIKNEVIANDPDIKFEYTPSYTPSIWTIILYLAVISIGTYIAYQKLYRRRQNTTTNTEPINLTDVQLHRQTS